MSLRLNPELLRNVRVQLRPRKLAVVAAISAALSICAAYFFFEVERDAPLHWATQLLQITVIAQALVLGAGGSIACLNSIFREKERNTFDFQRVSSLTSVELALGKLFGAPILMYFVFLCLMPLSFFAAVIARCSLSYYVAAYAALLVASLAFHTLSLLMSVLSIRGSQTGAIILILMLLWITSYGGGISSTTLFRLSSMGPFFSDTLISQTSWKVRDLETSVTWRGLTYESNNGMTDVLFGKHVLHFPVLLAIDAALALWFFLAIVRNIKRDPAEYEIYSPGQSLGFAVFLSLIFMAFFNWRADGDLDGAAFLLTLNMGVLTLLGLTLLRNRPRMRRIIRQHGGAPSWLDDVWPSPLLLIAAIATGALVVIGATLAGMPGHEPGAGFLVARVLFFALWLIRDQQFLQWATLRRGRNALVMGVVYLLIFYVCASTLLAALGCLDSERIAFSAFFLPSAVYHLDAKAWAIRPAIWAAAGMAQIAIIAFFFYLQRRHLVEFVEHPSIPAVLDKQLAS